jgi:hypothetical protein
LLQKLVRTLFDVAFGNGEPIKKCFPVHCAIQPDSLLIGRSGSRRRRKVSMHGIPHKAASVIQGNREKLPSSAAFLFAVRSGVTPQVAAKTTCCCKAQRKLRGALGSMLSTPRF